jgi:hypothetical protein
MMLTGRVSPSRPTVRRSSVVVAQILGGVCSVLGDPCALPGAVPADAANVVLLHEQRTHAGGADPAGQRALPRTATALK